MQYYYVKIQNNECFSFSESDVHHILHVMRMKSDDEVIVNYQEKFYRAKLVISNKIVYAKKIEILDVNNELECTINLICGLPKGEKLSLIVQKTVELGVKNIYLFNAKRSIAKFTNGEDKIQRYVKIAKEASEQSHRNVIPHVHSPLSLLDITKLPGDIKIVAYENEAIVDQTKLYSLLNVPLTGKTINIVIGPEGGLEEKEVSILKNAGYHGVSLGKRILRCETACIDLVAIIAFMAECK